MKQILKLAIFASFFSAGSATAQTTFSNDVSIKGGGTEDQLCVGDNCANDESYASNKVKIRIKDENTALEFSDVNDDDWIIEANQGGIQNLRMGNETDGRKPFMMLGAAPTNSLVIGDPRFDGAPMIGIGTALPETNLQITAPSVPTIRLQRPGNPFQTWDLQGSAFAFTIRDETRNEVPFIIEPTNQSNSLVIKANGDIGMGTNNPDVPLHVVENAGTATDILRLENNGGVVFRLKDTSPGGQEFTFQSNGGIFRIASPAVPGPEFTMDDNGNVTIKGTITTIGVCNVGCDRVFDEDYDLRPLPEHNALMWEQGHLPAVGPTAEDGPMNLSDKVGGMLNELEHAHIYIGQLHDEIDQLKRDHASELAALETRQQERINAILSRLSALESD